MYSKHTINALRIYLKRRQTFASFVLKIQSPHTVVDFRKYFATITFSTNVFLANPKHLSSSVWTKTITKWIFSQIILKLNHQCEHWCLIFTLPSYGIKHIYSRSSTRFTYPLSPSLDDGCPTSFI